jgi:hypothetical protein
MVHTKLPEELLFAIKEMDWFIGQNRRILHKECSEGKTPALSIIKKADGFWFNCFRCKELKGFFGDKQKSPEEVAQMLKNMETETPYRSMDVAYLPMDCVPMLGGTDSTPSKAYLWLWDHKIDDDAVNAFNICWSPSYYRVIIPIYEYGEYGGGAVAEVTTKLIGWVGRDIQELTKKQRKEMKCPKYITHKSSEYDNIFFHAPNYASNQYVITEDILSAIRVNSAMKVNAIALLTTYMPTRLMLKLRKKEVIMWLDPDMRKVTMGHVAKMNSFGMNAKAILSNKDPKCYNDLAIRQLMGAGKVGVDAV